MFQCVRPADPANDRRPLTGSTITDRPKRGHQAGGRRAITTAEEQEMIVHHRRSSSFRLNRRSALGGLGLAASALGLGTVHRVAAQATPDVLASHPIVGAWMVSRPAPRAPEGTTRPREPGRASTRGSQPIRPVADSPRRDPGRRAPARLREGPAVRRCRALRLNPGMAIAVIQAGHCIGNRRSGLTLREKRVGWGHSNAPPGVQRVS